MSRGYEAETRQTSLSALLCVVLLHDVFAPVPSDYPPAARREVPLLMEQSQVKKRILEWAATGWLQSKVWEVTQHLDEAQDFVQQTVVKLLESDLAEIPDDRSLESLAITILRNLMRDRLRQQRRAKLDYGPELPEEVQGHDKDAHTWPEQANEFGQLAQILEQAIEALPPKQREAVRQRFDGIPPAEAARRLDSLINTHKKNLQKGLKALRRRLEEAGILIPPEEDPDEG